MSFIFRKLKGLAVTAGVGAVTSYFMDPQHGSQRRRDVVDRVRAPIDAVRKQRSAAEGSTHGDADPTGGAAPAQAGDQPAG